MVKKVAAPTYVETAIKRIMADFSDIPSHTPSTNFSTSTPLRFSTAHRIGLARASLATSDLVAAPRYNLQKLMLHKKWLEGPSNRVTDVGDQFLQVEDADLEVLFADD